MIKHYWDSYERKLISKDFPNYHPEVPVSMGEDGVNMPTSCLFATEEEALQDELSLISDLVKAHSETISLISQKLIELRERDNKNGKNN